MIQSAIHPINPYTFMTDFEKAEIRAVAKTFPDSQMSGCLFHLGQAMFRKWKKLGIDSEQPAARETFRYS